MDIHESLNQILQAKDRLGVMFYDHFLTRYPEVQQHFQGVDLKRQSVLLTTALMIIERHHGHPTPAIAQYLQYLGTRHHTWRIPQDVFEVWIKAMLETMQQFHGDAWTPSLEGQWREAFQFAADQMFVGYEKHVVV